MDSKPEGLQPAAPTVIRSDKFYRVKEVAGFFDVGSDTVRRKFRKHPKVIKLGEKHKTLLIPGWLVIEWMDRGGLQAA